MQQPKSQDLPTIVGRPTIPGKNKMVAGSGAGNETMVEEGIFPNEPSPTSKEGSGC